MATSQVTSDELNPKGALIGGFGFAALALILVAVSIWFVSLIHGDYGEALESRDPIFLEKTGYTLFYFAPLVFTGLLIFGVACMAVGIRGKPYPKVVSERLNRTVASLVLIGLLGMFAGSYVANKLWAEVFRSHGYNECPGSFTITSKWFSTVWVDQPDLCHDENVLAMFREGEQVSTINRFVLERHP